MAGMVTVQLLFAAIRSSFRPRSQEDCWADFEESQLGLVHGGNSHRRKERGGRSPGHGENQATGVPFQLDGSSGQPLKQSGLQQAWRPCGR